MLVITRSEALPVLHRFIVAPITRTIRSIPTEIQLGKEEGLNTDCVASFDNLQPISGAFLVERAGALLSPRQQICAALAAMSDC